MDMEKKIETYQLLSQDLDNLRQAVEEYVKGVGIVNQKFYKILESINDLILYAREGIKLAKLLVDIKQKYNLPDDNEVPYLKTILTAIKIIQFHLDAMKKLLDEVKEAQSKLELELGSGALIGTVLFDSSLVASTTFNFFRPRSD